MEGRESGLSEDLLREIEEAADTEEAAAIRTKALQVYLKLCFKPHLDYSQIHF